MSQQSLFADLDMPATPPEIAETAERPAGYGDTLPDSGPQPDHQAEDSLPSSVANMFFAAAQTKVELPADEIDKAHSLYCADKLASGKPVRLFETNGRSFVITARCGNYASGYEVRLLTSDDTDASEYPGLDQKIYHRMKFKVGSEWWLMTDANVTFYPTGTCIFPTFSFDDYKPTRDFYIVFRGHQRPDHYLLKPIDQFETELKTRGVPEGVRWAYDAPPDAFVS